MEGSQKIWEKDTLRNYSGSYDDSETTTTKSFNETVEFRDTYSVQSVL